MNNDTLTFTFNYIKPVFVVNYIESVQADIATENTALQLQYVAPVSTINSVDYDGLRYTEWDGGVTLWDNGDTVWS